MQEIFELPRPVIIARTLIILISPFNVLSSKFQRLPISFLLTRSGFPNYILWVLTHPIILCDLQLLNIDINSSSQVKWCNVNTLLQHPCRYIHSTMLTKRMQRRFRQKCISSQIFLAIEFDC